MAMSDDEVETGFPDDDSWPTCGYVASWRAAFSTICPAGAPVRDTAGPEPEPLGPLSCSDLVAPRAFDFAFGQSRLKRVAVAAPVTIAVIGITAADILGNDIFLIDFFFGDGWSHFVYGK